MPKLVPGFRFCHLRNPASVGYLDKNPPSACSARELFPAHLALKAEPLLHHSTHDSDCSAAVLYVLSPKVHSWVTDSTVLC